MANDFYQRCIQRGMLLRLIREKLETDPDAMKDLLARFPELATPPSRQERFDLLNRRRQQGEAALRALLTEDQLRALEAALDAADRPIAPDA